ncbi:hypothetical protein [Streptomyces sp. NPDC002825]|uniref:Vgb family protein n=1 Tax=Streptomyces sp. NPDC002825 TaxID=3154666 RepID=UPI0033287229
MRRTPTTRRLHRLLTASLGGLLAVTAVAAPAQADVGDLTEYPITTTPDSYPAGITAGPDRALWYAGDGRIGRITTDGTVTDYPVPGDQSFTFDITRGPDGALWFTEPNADEIGRITTAGQVSEVALAAGSAPTGIALGTDRALWFTEAGATNRIGRMRPGGGVTEYAIPTPDSNPYHIAAAPDGSMWFTELAAGKIGRVDRYGTVTEFPLPTGYEFPSDIAAGPGGMWFTELGGSDIGRISLSGELTFFPLPTSSPGADGITRGPDGNMWFAEQAGAIGRITPAGKVTEFPVPNGADTVPYNIATGPDRGVWFTELIGNAIGRVQAVPGRGPGTRTAVSQATASLRPAAGPRPERSRRLTLCGPGSPVGAAPFCR